MSLVVGLPYMSPTLRFGDFRGKKITAVEDDEMRFAKGPIQANDPDDVLKISKGEFLEVKAEAA